MKINALKLNHCIAYHNTVYTLCIQIYRVKSIYRIKFMIYNKFNKNINAQISIHNSLSSEIR